MYAIIETGGKQYRVSVGDVIEIERVKQAKEEAYTFSSVLLVNNGDNGIHVGSPFVKGASVIGTILTNLRGQKIRVQKYKSKVRYRRVQGHRQALTKVKIDQIVLPGIKVTAKASEGKKETAKKQGKTAKSKKKIV